MAIEQNISQIIILNIPRPSIYPLFDPKYPYFGTLYPYLRVLGGSWAVSQVKREAAKFWTAGLCLRNEGALKKKKLEQALGLLHSMTIITRSPMGNDVDDCLGFYGIVHPPRFAKSLRSFAAFIFWASYLARA